MASGEKSISHLVLLIGMVICNVATTWLHLSCPLAAADKVKDHGIYKDNSISTYYNRAIQRQTCKEKTLEENARLASIIFTGTVKDVQPDPRGHEMAEVEIKRVIEGTAIIDQLPLLFVEGKYPSVRHRVVTIHGIGRPDICISSVRKHDTWIFLANFTPPDELQLHSSLVRMSLTNIALAEEAVKGKHYVHKNTEHKNIDLAASCEHKFCPFGGQCIVNHQLHSADCRCIETCDDIMSPVCGSDGVTYDNECRLRVMSCAQQSHIRILWNDSCEASDPCRNVKCRFRAKCVPSADRHSAFCQCPERCSDYGVKEEEEEGGTAMPVCSEDGVQYDSLCHLRKTSCQEMTEIKILNFGKCDLCRNILCGLYAVCVMDDSFGQPKCTCPSNCPAESHPVCGNNGQTYRNRCEMEQAACLRQQNISIVNNGSCANPCDHLECKYGAHCRNGACTCPTTCPTAEDPVCATNHETYENECTMLRSACNTRTPLAVLHPGECIEMSGNDEGCDDLRCQFGGTCQRHDGDSPQCICKFDCPAVRSLVCGSDGEIYSNECYMKKAACKTQTVILADSTGRCQDFEEDICDGNDVLVNHITKLEYDCSPGKDACPEESFCHIINETARCCVGMFGQPVSICQESMFGCCPDGKTPASGSGYLGCSSVCRCHPLGSLGDGCDPLSGQCHCKTGVGGPRCDRCEPNYWGMPKIAEGNDGCIPCECNVNGSIREDCEQMTGDCICKRSVLGPKCDICSDGSPVTETGCPNNRTHLTEKSVDFVKETKSEKPATLWTERPAPHSFSFPVKYVKQPPHVTKDYSIPSFSGMSYIQLQKLQHGSHEISIEIEFRPLAPNGLIFYTGQNEDGKGHFISIALRNGHVEFRYDLGSGPTLLRSNQQVTMKKLHKVTATRHGKDGLLKLDEGSEASAVSPGGQRLLNVGTPIYLGYIPNLTEQIAKNAGANSGFVGCIQFLRILSSQLNKEYELSKASSNDIEADSGITECDLRSCKTVLCENGGICSHPNHDNYTCTCASGFTGVLCEYEVADDL